jgi:thiol-disulfide isomerase/thioredoxin
LTNPLGKSALKVLLGLVFVVSAVLKLFDTDKFEIYIYSYHFFSLNASFMVARLAIIIELVLGIGLISHCLHKLMWWGSIAMLAGYSLLLIYAMYLGRTDSCHCFGDFLQLDPKQSLVKNGVLMLLFLPIYRMESWKTPFRWLILCLTVMVSTIAVFVISPPDNLTSNADPEQNLQLELFNEMLDDAPLDALNLREGKQVICFFSTSCEVCQLAAHKLSLMQQFYDFPKESITYLFMGNEESIAKFYEESGSAQYRNVLYPDVVRLLKAINGNFPVIVFLEDGEVVHEYGFRNMNESEIQAFMVI